MDAKKMKNPTARFWTKRELKITTNQCSVAGYSVTRDGDTTKVVNPENGDIVLMSLNNGTNEMVRLDKSYFGL